MNKLLPLGLIALSFFVATPVLAATFSAGQTYTLDKQTTLNDYLYAEAGSPIVSGTILGDAMLAGGTVTVNGTAKNNLMVAGGTITVLGNVGSSVRAIGGTVTLSGPIGADAVIAGGTVNIVDTATIGRDAAIAGGTVQLGGSIGRNVTIRGGTVVIDGTVKGNVDVQASQSLTLGEHAVINGNLTYSAPNMLTEKPGASVAGTTTYTAARTNPIKNYDPAEILAGLVGIVFVVRVLALLTAVIIVTTIFNRITTSATHTTLDAFWKHLSVGFVSLIAIPIACVVLLVSVFGLTIGFVGFLAYGALIVASKVLAPILAGAVMSTWYRKELVVDWKWSILGLIAIDLVGAIPIVGWVLGAVLFLAAFGTLTSLAFSALTAAR